MGVEHLVFPGTRKTWNLETDYPNLENYTSKNVTLSLHSHNQHIYYIKPTFYGQVSVRRGYFTPPESGNYRFIWNSHEATTFYFGESKESKTALFSKGWGNLQERNLLEGDRVKSEWQILSADISYYIEMRNEEQNSYANVALEKQHSSSHPLNPSSAQKVKINGNLTYEYHNFSVLNPPLDTSTYYKWMIYLNDENGQPQAGRLSSKIFSRCTSTQFRDNIYPAFQGLWIRVHASFKDKSGEDYAPSDYQTDENIGEMIYHVKIMTAHYTPISHVNKDRKPESVASGSITQSQLRHNSEYLFDLALDGEFELSLEHPSLGNMIIGPIKIRDTSSTIMEMMTEKYPSSWGKIDVFIYTAYVSYDIYHISFQFNGLEEDPPLMQFIKGRESGDITGGNEERRGESIEIVQTYSTNILFPQIPPEYLSLEPQIGQVVVKTREQTSLCPEMNCVFTYLDVSPQITSFVYDSVLSILTLQGTHFGDEVIPEVDIELGGSGCEVKTWSNTEINCTLGGDAMGGKYQPNIVYPEGKWPINTEDIIILEYSIDSITPSSDLNPQGGQPLTIIGTQFPPHLDHNNNHILHVYFDGVGELDIIQCSSTQIIVLTIPVTTSPVVKLVLNAYHKTYSGVLTLATLGSDFPQITEVIPAWGSPVFNKELNITGKYIYIYIYI